MAADSKDDSWKVSRFLSCHLDQMDGIGSAESVNFRRVMAYIFGRSLILPGVSTLCSGSKSEGLDMPGSDHDTMVVLDDVIVVQPRDVIRERDSRKTILVMDTTNCRPGFTLLRLHQEGEEDTHSIMTAITYMDGSQYLSSVAHTSNIITLLPGSYIHGPCASFPDADTDYAWCFRCRSWPHDLSDFSKRTKYCVWPPGYLVDNIVKYGCHVVAVGDKHSDLFAMQWRISFSHAEQVLVWSFNHIQLKVYALLKLFLKECIECDQSIKGLLCSYFMKTIVFHAIEHSSPSLWRDENCVQCFWYCFTILIESVQTGYLPNYFVPVHNMFLSNVTGDNRIRLLRVLSRYQGMGYSCLFECHSLQSLPQIIQESPSVYPFLIDSSIHEFDEDGNVWIDLQVNVRVCLNIRRALTLTNKLFMKCYNENLLDIVLLHLIQAITFESSQSLTDLARTKRNNKINYKQIRRHTRLLHVSSAADVCHGLLSLATYYYNTGSYHKASDVAMHVTLACQQRALLHNHVSHEEYKEEMCGKGYSLLQKAKRSFVFLYPINTGTYRLYPPELEVEVQTSDGTINLPPVPYALFLLVLSSFRLGNTDQSQTILGDLTAVQEDPIYGVCYYPIVHNLVGICHQLLGNTRQAIRAFEEASRQLPDNSAAVIRICELQRNDKDDLDYFNVPPQNQRDEKFDDDDMLNDCHKTMYNLDPIQLVKMSWFKM